MKKSLILPLLLAVTQAQSAVECTNQNVKISPTTPTENFVLYDDGTATHHSTGLMWMRCSLGQSWLGGTCTGDPVEVTWQGALQLAADINSGDSNTDNDGQTGFSGYSDWRLPNRNELESIIEDRCWGPAINTAVFTGSPSWWYWTSSPNVSYSNSAWYVNFVNGGVSGKEKSWSSYYVRLVRAGQ